MRIERQVLFWIGVTVLLVLAILALRDVLLPFVAGLVIAYALNPLAERMTALGLPRTAAAGVIVGLLFASLLLTFVFVAPLLLAQIQQIAVTLPGEFERVQALLDAWARATLGDRYSEFQAGLQRAGAELANNWAGIASVVARSVWAHGLALVNLLSLLLITPLVVFYLLIDWPRMLATVDRWLPRDQEPAIRRLAGEINATIAAFIRGQGLVCLILGVFYAVGLTWIGVSYGLLVGIATGILSFVPFVGWALGLLTASAIAAVQYWPDLVPLLEVIALFGLGQALDAAFLSPKIVGNKIGLHPVWLIFALFAFGYLLGFVGLLIAVPLAAAIHVIARFALEVYFGSTVYQGRTGRTGAEAPSRSDEHTA